MKLVRYPWPTQVMLGLLASLFLNSTCSSQVPPTDTNTSSTATSTTTSLVFGHYAENTSDETRAAHRTAVRHLRAGENLMACEVLDAIDPAERRRLTEYLTLLCATRLPDRAMLADDSAIAVSRVEVPPGLRDSERDALDRHRAWIAAIQDTLADAAQGAFQLPGRPLPRHLQNSRDLSALSAWQNRGTRFHAPTYNAARQTLQVQSLVARLAIDNLLSRLERQTAHQILFADLTGITVPPPPTPTLPHDEDL